LYHDTQHFIPLSNQAARFNPEAKPCDDLANNWFGCPEKQEDW
jgi:hypothetical protein